MGVEELLVLQVELLLKSKTIDHGLKKEKKEEQSRNSRNAGSQTGTVLEKKSPK